MARLPWDSHVEGAHCHNTLPACLNSWLNSVLKATGAAKDLRDKPAARDTDRVFTPRDRRSYGTRALSQKCLKFLALQAKFRRVIRKLRNIAFT